MVQRVRTSIVDSVYTLEDLSSWSSPGTFLAVVGHPVVHSLSPQMHNAALRVLAQQDPTFDEWQYVRFDIEPDYLERALQLFHEKKFKGLNLTLPHKVRALNSVREIAPMARVLGAVNTLSWTPTGYRGDNTDGFGIQKAVEQTLGFSFVGKKVLILGAGGACRAIAVQCLQLGVSALSIANRSLERLQELLERIEPVALEQKAILKGLELDAVEAMELFNPDLIINATALGLKTTDPSPIDGGAFPAEVVVYDTTYGVAENGFSRWANTRGLRYASGLSMLVWQGVRSLEIWTSANVSADVMEKAAQSTLISRQPKGI
jgi:shikimate dehydrogenase